MIVPMRRATIGGLLAVGTVALGGCDACGKGDGHVAQAASMPPLVVPAPTAPLDVGGFGSAVVALPGGATRPTPVLVAVLGIGDTPEEQCSTWRDIVRERAFVLCPRGAPNMVEEVEDAGAEAAAPAAAALPKADTEAEEGDATDLEAPPPSPPRSAEGGRHADGATASRPKRRQVGFYPVDLTTLEREVSAALAALKARYGAYVADNELVYAGFSRGAFLGAQLVAKRPERFRRVVLIEGGQTPWQHDAAAAFARGGGERILFVCGQPSCVEESEPAAAVLRGELVTTRVVHGAGEGHGYQKQVKDELRRSFGWVTEGRPAWTPL
jgi:predicted esterase